NVVTDIYGDTAVMHGRMWMDVFVVDERRKVPIDNQFTAVWIRGQEAWLIVAWASTPVSESARARSGSEADSSAQSSPSPRSA
ncbi:MAG: hypothetical protein JWQ90_1209, partial [Hydrocarboniphaga sp.]